MNKRKYTTPELKMVSIGHQTYILAGSPGILTSEKAAGQDNEVLSRRSGGFWGDDEDE